MKKVISLILCLCTSLFLLTACSDVDKSNTEDAMGLLKKSSEFYNEIKNVKLDSEIESVMIYNDMFTGEPAICGTTLDINSLMYNEPFRFTSEVLFTYDDTIVDGGVSYIMENNTKTIQHGISENDKISIYQNADEEWLRVDLSNEDFMLNDTLGLNYITNYDKYIKDGKIVGKEKIDDIDIIKAEFTLNEEYVKIMFKKYGFEEFAKIIDSANTDKAILDMMKGATFTVWFDENSDEIAKVEVNLTSLMETFRKIVIEDNKEHLSEEKYAYLNECADKISIKNTIRFSNIDNNEDFKLPEEAKEAKVHGQE